MAIKKTAERPIMTASVYNQVSDYRKGMIQNELERGMWRDGSGGAMSKATSASFLATSSETIKTAQAIGGSGGTGSGDWRGSSSTLRQMPDIYSPLWLNSNLNLPKDITTMNAWNRAFYALQPFVQNAINLHSTLPISKLNIKCADPRVQQHFEEMNEEIGLQNVCIDVAQEYWLQGEAFPFATLDQTNAKWSRIFLQNPDYLMVKKTPISSEPIIVMRPDTELQRLVRSNRPVDVFQRKQLDPEIVDHIRKGENIPLNNFNISHLSRKISPYSTRGTGLVVSCFRQLMLLDQLRECKYVQAQEMINPVTLVKIGGPDYKPTPEDIDIWRQAWAQSISDKNFKIFTHEAVTVEKIGSGAAVMDTLATETQLLKEIFMGLMVPEVIMTGGGDISYANGGISLDVLKQRYMHFRNMMTAWLKTKIFAPISKMMDFYELVNGEKRLIVPDVEWNALSLFESSDYINMLSQLSTGEDKRVSKETLYKSLGLDIEDERRKMRDEDIQAAIRKKEIANLDKMSLNDLRSIGDDQDIADIIDTVDPNDSPYASGLPGQVDSGGGSPPGGGGMSLPDLGGLGAPPSGPSPPSGGSSPPPLPA